MHIARGLLGLVVFCLLSWLLSSHRRRFPWRVVAWGLLLQVVLAALLLQTDAGRAVFEGLAAFVQALIAKTEPGARMVFGVLADPAALGAVFGPGQGFVLGFAGTGLVVIIFFSALMSVLYHVGVMQVLIGLLARTMTALMGVSGAESLAMAANVFVGMTEAPLVIRPYVAAMTRSELNALMTGGFATIAGSVMAVYMGLLGPQYGPHLITASVLSAPAAFLIAKIMLPETERPATAGTVDLPSVRTARNVVEAAAIGTSDGLKLWLNVLAMLIAFTALMALVDWPLAALGEILDLDGGLSLGRIFGWLLAPLAWVIGIEGWSDCQAVGSLLGTKVAVNELVAYTQLVELAPRAGVELPDGAGPAMSVRSAQMSAYALCGFANFASIGIQLGGITPLAPERRGDLAELGLRAMIGGAFASWMTATVAGMFLA